MVKPEIAALKAEVDALKAQWASGSPEWADLKAKYDAAVDRVGVLEAQLANQPPPATGLEADDLAALEAIKQDVKSVTQGVADSRVVNSPAN